MNVAPNTVSIAITKGENSSLSKKGVFCLEMGIRPGRGPPLSSFVGQNMDTHQDAIKTGRLDVRLRHHRGCSRANTQAGRRRALGRGGVNSPCQMNPYPLFSTRR